MGLIERSIQGNRIYYKVNKECPIVEDLKNIFFKSVGIAEVLRDNFKEKGIKVAFIYGSYAKGEESLLSDIDLMVIGDISSKELSSILSKPKKELMREINYVVFSLNEFINKAMRKDHFINSVLKNKKIYLIGSKDELKGLIKSGQAKAT
jgi:predicted nucleotidyltransferase